MGVAVAIPGVAAAIPGVAAKKIKNKINSLIFFNQYCKILINQCGFVHFLRIWLNPCNITNFDLESDTIY